MKSNVIKLLVQADNFISGEEISKSLSVSRSAVWKVIQSLKADGAEIESSTRTGYRLKRLPDILKPEYVRLYLKILPDIHWFNNIGSTNSYLKDLAANSNLSDIVAIAENQSAGRGRMGRSWESTHGDSIQMSILTRPDIAPMKAGAYNFAIALAICSTVKKVCGVNVGIKWPNDVVYGDKKLCGILTELSADIDCIEYIVCGAGLNVNQQSFIGDLGKSAISLKMITGTHIDRVKLCAEEINYIFKYFKMIESGYFTDLMNEYKDKSVIVGKSVKVLYGNTEFFGECIGFGEIGELLLKIDDKIRAFHAGEVSLRGLNSYV